MTGISGLGGLLPLVGLGVSGTNNSSGQPSDSSPSDNNTDKNTNRNNQSDKTLEARYAAEPQKKETDLTSAEARLRDGSRARAAAVSALAAAEPKDPSIGEQVRDAALREAGRPPQSPMVVSPSQTFLDEVNAVEKLFGFDADGAIATLFSALPPSKPAAGAASGYEAADPAIAGGPMVVRAPERADEKGQAAQARTIDPTPPAPKIETETFARARPIDIRA